MATNGPAYRSFRLAELVKSFERLVSYEGLDDFRYGLSPRRAWPRSESMASRVQIILASAQRLICGLCFVGIVSLPTTCLAESTADKIEQVRSETRAPGVVAGVFDGAGNEVDVWVAGHRDDRRQTPITRRDHFCIASVSKLFVGNLALQLVDEGKLKTKDKLSTFLPDYPRADSITVAMLGHHQSGVADPIRDDGFQEEILRTPDRDWSINKLISRAADSSPLGTAGSNWNYSNMNSVLLAKIAQSVAGDTYSDLLKTRILGPAKLRQTGVLIGSLPAPAPRGYRHGKPDRWLGYGDDFVDVTFASPGWTGPAGNLYSTLDDLAEVVPILVTGRNLSPASREELHRWLATSTANQEYGFHLEHRDGWMGHCGNVPGFNAAVWFHPDFDRTVVVLANLSNAADGTMPAEAIADLLKAQCESR